MKITKIFKKKEEPKEESLKKLALKEIKKIEKKKNIEERFEEFTKTFRIFIKEALVIKKEFTHEELIEELKKKKIKEETKNKIIKLSKEIKEFEFSGKNPTGAKINKKISEFKKIIKSI